jgi:hypothetical protein
VDKIPDDGDARRAFLEEWARSQQSRLDAEALRRAVEAETLAAEEWAEAIAHVMAQARQRIGRANSVGRVAAVPVVITKPSDLPADRAAVFADLMIRLREYKWADPVVSECDEPMYIAPTAIALARKHRPGAPWFLYMEDDVILGPDFELLPGLLSEADETFPGAGVVSFFSGGTPDPGWSVHPMRQFGYLQCAAVRNTDYLAGFRAVIDHVVSQDEGKRLYEIPDLALATFLTIEYDSYALWCPSLVQHANVTSAFSGQPTGERISKSYKQAYG